MDIKLIVGRASRNRIVWSSVFFVAAFLLLSVLVTQSQIYYTYSNLFDILFLGLFVVLFASSMGLGFRKGDLIYLAACLLYFLATTLFFTRDMATTAVSAFWVLLWIVVLENANIRKKDIRWISAILFLAVCYLVLLSKDCGEWFDFQTGEFILNPNRIVFQTRLNPNTIGFLLALFSGLLLAVSKEWAACCKTGCELVLIAVTLAGLICCKSRTSMLMFLLFLFLKYALPMKYKQNYRFVAMLSLLIIAAGCILPVIYTTLYTNRYGIGLEFMGKDIFTGREWIWEYLFEEVGKIPFGWIFGIGAHGANIEDSVLNAHNAYLSIYMRFGAVGVAAFFGYYIYRLKKFYTAGSLNRTGMDVTMLGISTLLSGYFETVTLWHPMLFFTGFVWALPVCLTKGDPIG